MPTARAEDPGRRAEGMPAGAEVPADEARIVLRLPAAQRDRHRAGSFTLRTPNFALQRQGSTPWSSSSGRSVVRARRMAAG